MFHEFVDEVIARQARRFPTKSALVVDGESTTYDELQQRVDHAARALVKIGLRPGDRVGLFAQFSPAILSVYLACLRIGAITAATHHSLSDEKLIHQLKHAGARVLVTDRRDGLSEICEAAALLRVVTLAPAQKEDRRVVSLDALEACADTLPLRSFSDTHETSIFYTTGSTYAPKGVLVNHQIMVSACEAVTSYLGIEADDVVMSYSTLASDYGVYNVLMPLYRGATAVVERTPPQVPEDILAVVERERVTAMHVFPPVLFVLSQTAGVRQERVRALRYLSTSGQPLHPKHIDSILAAMPGTTIYSNYGMTECKRISYLTPNALQRKPTSVGKPLPEVTALIVNDDGAPVSQPGQIGELWVSAPYMMLGYWDMPDETAAAFATGPDGQRMLKTGDLFQADSDGDLYYVARRDDIFVRGGWNVNPRDIERCLTAHPAILEAVVVPVPDESAGYLPKAFIVPARGCVIIEKELTDYCGQHIDWHMVPAAFEIVETLPRSHSGKSTGHGLT